MKTHMSFLQKAPSRLNIRALIVLASFLLLIDSPVGSAQRIAEQNSDERPTAFSGVKFKVPKYFRLEQSSNSEFAFMRHNKDDLALIVAAPKNQQIDDRYLTDLSSGVVSTLLLPQEQKYRWKVLRHSQSEINTRLTITTKGFNNRTYVQCDFVVVKAQGREVVLGSILKSNNERNAGYLFDIEGHEYSLSGWKALFELIASVTGDKYD